jgi:DnaB-like helicase N terminal domain/AAA domain
MSFGQHLRRLREGAGLSRAKLARRALGNGGGECKAGGLDGELLRQLEKSVLGTMLRDNAVIPEVLQVLRPENFYSDPHQRIARAVVQMHARGEPIDLVSLAHALDSRKEIEEVGGYCYLGELWQAPAMGRNALAYARIVRQKDDGRRAERLLDRAAAEARDGRPVAELLEDVSREAEALRGPASDGLGLVDSAQFAAADYSREWLVRGLLVRGQPAGMGGPKKSLKTSVLVDLALSLGAARPFLRVFFVPRRCRVAVLSGESGEATLQETARRVAAAKGVDLAAADVLWGFRLPRLADPAQVAALGCLLRQFRVEVLILDPLYLALLAGGGTDTPEAVLSPACSDGGAVPSPSPPRRVHWRRSPRPPEVAVRKWLLVALGSGLAAVVAAAVVYLYGMPQVDQRHFDRVKVGMRRAEVEAILGGPPSYWNTGAAHVVDEDADLVFPPGALGTWQGSSLVVLVGMDGDGAVCWKDAHAGGRRGDLLDGLLSRLGLR